MPMMSLPMAALTSVAMMVAMMMPSLAPGLRRHHRHLRTIGIPSAGSRVSLFAAGYLTVWILIGLVLFSVSTRMPSVTSWSLGVVVLAAGLVQRSRWKAKQLVRCRETCVRSHGWRSGCHLGVACALSCAAPMAVLFVAGPMDVRTMLLITVAITAERVAPGGVRIARLTGAAALVVGVLLCVAACVRIAIPVW